MAALQINLPEKSGTQIIQVSKADPNPLNSEGNLVRLESQKCASLLSFFSLHTEYQFLLKLNLHEENSECSYGNQQGEEQV